MSIKKKYFVVFLVVIMAGSFFSYKKTHQRPDLRSAYVLQQPIELPDFSLINQEEKPVNKDTFMGQWDLVFFGFTNCPDICPTTMQTLNQAKQELKKSNFKQIPRIVLVSVDPERDSPAMLGKYIDYFGEGNIAVTGNTDELIKLTKALGIYFEKAITSSKNYAVNHSAAVLLINPAAEFSALFSAPHKIENYINDLQQILGGANEIRDK
ncbi:MAG: SCO family protein [Gammaproteobacteria bacterium]|nr:SCO family protein [Gammaproteobacteria bacterium]